MREKAPQGEEPLEWRLIITIEIDSQEKAVIDVDSKMEGLDRNAPYNLPLHLKRLWRLVTWLRINR